MSGERMGRVSTIGGGYRVVYICPDWTRLDDGVFQVPSPVDVGEAEGEAPAESSCLAS